MVWRWDGESSVFEGVGWLQGLWASRETVCSVSFGFWVWFGVCACARDFVFVFVFCLVGAWSVAGKGGMKLGRKTISSQRDGRAR